jgi:hypothetical protein
MSTTFAANNSAIAMTRCVRPWWLEYFAARALPKKDSRRQAVVDKRGTG